MCRVLIAFVDDYTSQTFSVHLQALHLPSHFRDVICGCSELLRCSLLIGVPRESRLTFIYWSPVCAIHCSKHCRTEMGPFSRTSVFFRKDKSTLTNQRQQWSNCTIVTWGNKRWKAGPPWVPWKPLQGPLLSTGVRWGSWNCCPGIGGQVKKRWGW